MSVNEVERAIQDAFEVKEPSWPEPDLILLHPLEIKPPRFPEELFGDFWSNWIKQSAESKSCPVDYTAAGLLCVASTLIGNAIWASAWNGWNEPPILWLACVGKPSSGKSPGLDSAVSILRKLQAEKIQHFRANRGSQDKDVEVSKRHRKIWEQSLQKAIEAGEIPPDLPEQAKEPKRPSPPRLFTTDATAEAIVHRLLQNPKGLLLIRDELAGWISMMDKYSGNSGSDRAFWLEAYGGRSYCVDRVKHLDELISISHASVSILGSIQPDRLQTLFFKGDDDGLSSRFNYIWPDSMPPKRPVSVPDDTFALIALRRLDQLTLQIDDSGIESSPFFLPLSEEGAQLLQDFREKNYVKQESATGLYLSYLGKQPGLVLRLSLIFELLWHCANPSATSISEISKSAVVAGCQFISEYLDPMTKRALGEISVNADFHRASLAARRIYNDGIPLINKRTHLMRSKLCKSADQAQKVIDTLLEAGWIRAVESPEVITPGKTRGDYEVNPKLWE